MPWTPKASAPTLINLGSAMVAKIGGNPAYSWLGSYVPLLGSSYVAVADMCAQGPPQVQDFHLEDFMVTYNPTGVLNLPSKITLFATSQVFGDY